MKKKSSERRLPSRLKADAKKGTSNVQPKGTSNVQPKGTPNVETRTSKGEAGAQVKKRRRTSNLIPAKRRRKRNRPQGEAEKRALLQLQAFEMRAQKCGYREIATRLAVSVETAYRLVNEYWGPLEGKIKEEADFVRAMELGTLDEMERRFRPLVLDAGLKVETVHRPEKGAPYLVTVEAYQAAIAAGGMLLSIQARRAKLLGIDTPEKVEHTGSVGLTLEEFRARMKEARA